jgi:hypothetical protein
LLSLQPRLSEGVNIALQTHSVFGGGYLFKIIKRKLRSYPAYFFGFSKSFLIVA